MNIGDTYLCVVAPIHINRSFLQGWLSITSLVPKLFEGGELSMVCTVCLSLDHNFPCTPV